MVAKGMILYAGKIGLPNSSFLAFKSALIVSYIITSSGSI